MTAASRARTGSTLAAVGAFAATMALLHVAGRGDLAAPPLTSLAGTGDWLAAREPSTAAVALVRLAALGLGYHVALGSVLAAAGHVFRSPRLTALADAITLPPFRSTAGRLAGLALSATALAGHLVPGASGTVAPASAASVDAPAGADASVLIRRVALAPPAPTATSGTGGTASIRPVPDDTAADAVPTAGPAPVLHRVESGDHLWGIAETTLGRVWGREPTDAEIVPFWRSVIAANPDIVDPDLILPGQQVVVPPPPPAPM